MINNNNNERYQVPDNVEDFDPKKAYQELLRLEKELAKIKAKYE